MNKKTLDAVIGSCKKWFKIMSGTGKDNGPENCSLCKLFWKDGCKACPVYARTKKADCKNTPYYLWFCHDRDIHNIQDSEAREVECPACCRLAAKEFKFLLSFIPKDKLNKILSQIILE